MKIYISADMEGISGIVSPDQTNSQHKEYERARQLMTDEVNAAVAGALAGGATEVLVNDSHGNMGNLLIEHLHERAHLISGSPKPLSMMQGIDEGVDRAFFVGYHAQAGTQAAVLEHTYNSGCVWQVALNGRPLGETGLNAALAGHSGVPVALVTGDLAVCKEARELLGDNLEAVAVKRSYGRQAARNLPPVQAHRAIREAAERATSSAVHPFVVRPPVTVTVDFIKTTHADVAAFLPGSRRSNPRRVEFTAPDMPIAYQALLAMLRLAWSA
ncbi:MAG: M55 family metallopeptidase [Chloroflexi bacterium]|nr:M55 family metallopeptidase [Chloroflexota bacterium]MBU1748583.1 M55 family metallopeptidase [Chloroflexota bacterium]